MGGEFEDFLDDTMSSQLSEPRVVGIHQDMKDPKSVFDPTHPDADKNGNVKMPNVQVMTEMVNMIAATRAYEANATALSEAKNMAIKALEIGR
jgi:flagellar basal-body rod protein FlgC